MSYGLKLMSGGGRKPSGLYYNFNPLLIPWYSLQWASGDAMSAENYVDGDPVGTWPNEASGESAVAAGGNRPIFRPTGLNGKPSLEFDGLDDRIVHEDTLSPGVNDIEAPFTIVTIARVDKDPPFSSSTVGSYIYDGRPGTFRHILSAYTTGWRIFSSSDLITSDGVDNDTHLFMAYHNSASSELVIDNGTPTVGDVGTGGFNGLAIGDHNTGNWTVALDGHVAFVGVIAGDVRLNAKWNDFVVWAKEFYGIA